MPIDDLKQQIETTLSTTKKPLKLEELRILAVLFLLLLAPAGSRPEATFKLQFKDITVALGRPRRRATQASSTIHFGIHKSIPGRERTRVFPQDVDLTRAYELLDFISAQEMLDRGLYNLLPELEGFAQWEAQPIPPWANPVIELREKFYTQGQSGKELAVMHFSSCYWRAFWAALGIVYGN
ncbi:hypothetical protein K456DRAFT_43307 [Colletotrichum gloeosporioides 23]|nr:hypothetical protein K456DRAFT_43307 [Colletotrichum gloeosporioides 23]